METADQIHADLEDGCGDGGERQLHSVPLSEGGGEGGGGENHTPASSDADERSWHSAVEFAAGRCSNLSATEIVDLSHKKRDSSASDRSVEVDLEAGVPGRKLHLVKSDRDCRICHLSFDAANQESGYSIELGCCCKGDLAAAHKQCAEAWFKIRGNKICEICGSVACNVVGVTEAEMEQWSEGTDASTVVAEAAMMPPPTNERRNFWQGHRFLNFLLACMVFAFVISWLFHFNVPS